MNTKLLLLSFLIYLTVSASAFSKTLIISDSHGVGAFGGELASQLEAQGETVLFYAYGGTKAVDWIQGNNLTWGYWEHRTGRLLDRRGTDQNTPKLVDLIKLHSPTTVIMVLGTNMIWREQKPQDAEDIRYLMNASKNALAKCIWVGQPDLNVNNDDAKRWDLEMQQLLEKEVPAAGCQLIRSWEFTNYPENMGDGIHYDQIPGIGAKLAKEWAINVFQRMITY